MRVVSLVVFNRDGFVRVVSLAVFENRAHPVRDPHFRLREIPHTNSALPNSKTHMMANFWNLTEIRVQELETRVVVGNRPAIA